MLFATLARRWPRRRRRHLSITLIENCDKNNYSNIFTVLPVFIILIIFIMIRVALYFIFYYNYYC